MRAGGCAAVVECGGRDARPAKLGSRRRAGVKCERQPASGRKIAEREFARFGRWTGCGFGRSFHVTAYDARAGRGRTGRRPLCGRRMGAALLERQRPIAVCALAHPCPPMAVHCTPGCRRVFELLPSAATSERPLLAAMLPWDTPKITSARPASVPAVGRVKRGPALRTLSHPLPLRCLALCPRTSVRRETRTAVATLGGSGRGSKPCVRAGSAASSASTLCVSTARLRLRRLQPHSAPRPP